MSDCAAKGVSRRINRHHPVRLHGDYLCTFPDLSAAQKIDASIVCNSEQPRPERKILVVRIKLPIGLEKGLLDNVFAVQNRSPSCVSSNGEGWGGG